MTKIEEGKITKIIPDDKNMNRHNQYGMSLLEKSISELGLGRSILVDKNNRIIAGNGVTETAANLGLEDVIIVPTDGKKLVVVKREDIDIDSKEGRELALTDNAVANVNLEWDTENLQEVTEEWGIEAKDWGVEMPELEVKEEAEEDDFDVPVGGVETDIVLGDLFEIGEHRLLCGDSTQTDTFEKLMQGDLADMVVTDPPYNVAYEGKTKDSLTIENDSMSNDEFYKFLYDFYTALTTVCKKGAAIYVWHASAEVINFAKAMVDAGWLLKQQLIWVKNSMVMGRQDYQWKHEPCQLPGTSVVMEGGQTKPIEQITKNDRVVGLERASLQLTGWNKSGTGKKVKGTASRQYEGIIYHISVGEAETNATDNHKFTVRYNKAEAAKYYVYLMKKGERWRVGISQLKNSRGSGMRDRIRGEKADALWIVSQGYENKIDAQIQETIIGLKYRIPQTVWNTGKPGRICEKNDDQISRIYDEIGVQVIDKGARELLGNRINHPQIIRNKGKESTTSGFTVEACNLMPKVYEVLMPHKTATGTIVAQYQQITRIRTEEYQGPVYSLSVEGQHYISDGIVTHNCLYGWLAGGPHKWYSDRSQTTVINFDKPLRNGEYPTMKPIGLFGYQIENSSKVGDIVIDAFGGSGTTMVACEQLNRKARLIEYDPKYCQVIIDRMLKLNPALKIKKNGSIYEHTMKEGNDGTV